MTLDLKQSLAALVAVGALATTPALAFADEASPNEARNEARVAELARYGAESGPVQARELDAVPEFTASKPSARERRLRYNQRSNRGLAADPRFRDYLAPLDF